jgi:hydrogenase maturation protease
VVRTIILGIGNPVLRDDSVGIMVAGHFAGRVDTEILTTTGFDILGKLLGYDRAVIVDGIRAGREPGTVLELDPQDIFGGADFTGTHNLGLGATLDLGYRIFGAEMPAQIRIVAVEVEDTTTFGTGCTAAVAAAVPEAVERVRRWLEPAAGKVIREAGDAGL